MGLRELRRLLWISLAAGTAGCQIPAQDNPHDPRNRPVARMRVVDRGAPDPVTGCPVVVGTGAFLEVVSASRGRCLALDARDSDSPPGNTLDLVFTVLDASGSVLASPTPDPAGHERLAPLEGFLRTLPFGEPLTAHVKVTDVDLDFEVSAEAALTLENSAPVLVLPEPRILPLGGLPWAAGLDFQDVAFGIDGSFDADGDPLHVCWSFAGETGPECPAPGSPSDLDVSREIPSDARGPFVGTAQLCDGPVGSPRSCSRAERAVVRVREPDVWLHRGTTGLAPDGAVLRLDGSRLSYPFPLASVQLDVGQPGQFVDGATPVVVLCDGTFLRSISWPQGVVIDSEDLGSGPHAIAVGEGRHLWAVGNSKVSGFIVDPAGLLVPNPGPTPTPPPITADCRVAVDPAGRGWASCIAGTGSHSESILGGAAISLPGRRILGLAARPGTDEVWVVDEPDGTGPAFLRKFLEPEGPAFSWELETETATALAWAGSDTLWLAHGDLGLLRLDALLLDQGAVFAEDTALETFPLFSVDALRADPVSGTAWASSSLVGQSWRVDVRGGLDFVGGSVRLLGADLDGAMLFGDPAASIVEIQRGTTVEEAAVDRVMPFPAALGGAADPGTGGAWLYRPDQADVIRVDREGVLVEKRTGIRVGATDEAVPSLASFRPSADGTRAWAVETLDAPDYVQTGRVLFLDLTADPMPATVIALPNLYGAPRFPFLEPSFPDGRFAWAMQFVGGGAATVVMVGSAGTITQPGGAGDVPERAQGTLIARGARVPDPSNALCLAAWDSLADQLRVRRIHTDGTVETFADDDLPLADPLGALHQVAASREGGANLCWVAWRSGALATEVRGYADSDQIPDRSATHALALPASVEFVAMAPQGEGALWLLDAQTSGTGAYDYRVFRLDFTAQPLAPDLLDLGSIGSSFFPQPDGPSPAFLSLEAPVQRAGY